MKLRKQIKNRVVAVAMLAVVLFGTLYFSVPIEKTHAMKRENRPFLNTTFDFGYEHNDSDYYLYQYLNVSGQVVSFYCTDVGNNHDYIFQRWIISESPISGTVNERHYYADSSKSMDDGHYSQSSRSWSIKHDDKFTYNGKTYYLYCSGSDYSLTPQPYYTWFGNLGKLYRFNISSKEFNKYRGLNYIKDYISDNLDTSVCTMVTEGEDISTDETTWEGGQDKPKKDTDIGYLVLKNTNVNQQSDLGTLKDGVLPLYFNIDWKDKTSTGFSLTKNKYARTFIQMEVESKFVVYSDVKHTKIKHKFDNYGERGWLSKNIDPSNKPITFDSGDINNALPLTYNEILNQVDKNKIYGSLGQAIFPIGYNFLIRYRIVCTDSLTVIPDTSSGWHAGPWASTTLSGDDINDTSSNKSDHEGYGDDKNKNGETDDINHTRTDYDDNQDAKDNINDKKNDKSSLDLDSAKEFINQIADVPKMIGDIFSFLPDWVKYSFAFGFALIPILIIFKLIRG